MCRQGCYTLVLVYFVFSWEKKAFFVWSYTFAFSECFLGAEVELASLKTSISFKQSFFPPELGPDNFHSHQNSRTSARKNIKCIYMFDAKGQRRKNG